MATNHVQQGAIMPWTNGTGSAVSANDVVVVGNFVCVALGDIADGAAGVLATEEVFEIPKNNNLVISQGDAVYWDVTDGNINKTAEDNYYAGLAFAAATQTATTVKVKLGAYGLLTNLV
jgi:predicted RecA/RadA family phage recombinase